MIRSQAAEYFTANSLLCCLCGTFENPASMVEGPGCTRNGQKVRAAFIGKHVVGVAGHDNSKVAGLIRARTLIDCLTLGKELWLIFADEAGKQSSIRCHFGMNGSLHCDSQPEHPGQLTLLVRFHDGCQLQLFDATTSPADAQAARHAVQEGCNRDVCQPAFDEAVATAALTASPADRMICDALLDQSIVPGIGNIIKNEALHASCMDPRRLVSSLSPPELQTLVRAARAFSLAWCRAGRHPACHIYNRTRCQACGGPVSFCKMGALGPPRPTFWCAARAAAGTCAKALKPPADAVAEAVAPIEALVTALVTAPAPKRPRSLPQSLPPASNPWTFSVPAAPMPAAPLMPAAPPSVLAAQPLRTRHPLGVACMHVPTAPPAHTSENLSEIGREIACRADVAAAAPPLRGRVCPRHGRHTVVLRRVRRTGDNFGRLFLSCRERDCEHFVWSDGAFPACACTPARSAGLRISKKAESGGRWYFGCRRRDAQACGFFRWAAAEETQALGDLLRPLT